MPRIFRSATLRSPAFAERSGSNRSHPMTGRTADGVAGPGAGAAAGTMDHRGEARRRRGRRPEAGGFMDTALATAGTAAALFAATNVDDLVVLAVLSASSRAAGRPRRWQIWAGQYAAITVLVVVAVAAGRGLARLPGGWAGLLGLLPLGLG